MKSLTISLFATLLVFAACAAESAQQDANQSDMTNQANDSSSADSGNATSDDSAVGGGIYAMEATSLDGEKVSMADYRGKVTLIVNVASECGYTPQYAGLQQLHSEMADKGFAVLGFPSNEFGGQEPGTAEQIREFCTSRFSVDFPMFAKIETKSGDGQSPIFSALQKATGEQPKWNFCKYLVGKDGAPIAFYASGVKPDSAELRQAIDAALN